MQVYGAKLALYLISAACRRWPKKRNHCWPLMDAVAAVIDRGFACALTHLAPASTGI